MKSTSFSMTVFMMSTTAMAIASPPWGNYFKLTQTSHLDSSMIRFDFGGQKSRSKTALELVHTDLAGCEKNSSW